MATTPYSLAREARKGDGNKSRIVVETPGVKDETEKPKIRATSPEDVRRAEIINRGGAYSDRIKIPAPVAPRKEPLPSDSDIQKSITSQKTTT